MTKLKPGDKFERLTVQELGPGKSWRCLCECGVTKVISNQNLKSCGCLRAASHASGTHGMSRHPAYLQYHRMAALCKTFTRVPRKVNKGPDDFKNRLHEPKPKPARQRFPKAKYDIDGQLIPPPPPPPPRPTLLELFGYVQRPILIWPDVSTFELFWAALGPSWFPGARLVRINEQAYAPDPLLDAGSAMRADNLKWVPK